MTKRRLIASLLAAATLAGCATTRSGGDADTRAWWRVTSDLSGDAMEGRDTGSAGHSRAAAYVAERFRRAGLKPAGDDGSFIQRIPLHETAVGKDGTSVMVVRQGGGVRALRFLHEVSVRPTDALPATLDAPLAFRGYCSRAEIGEVRGRVAVCFGSRRTGTPSAADRLNAAAAAGAVGLINIDDKAFNLEPPRWPAAYARTVTQAGAPAPAAPRLVVLRLNADVFGDVIAGTGRDAAALLAAGGRSEPLPAFDIPARLTARFAISRRNYTSENVVGVLPGTDPAVAGQHVLLGAHLDGYGYGEPVNGDRLYNGALDDAAYVATLIRFAERRGGRGLRRPVVFAAFTGEEKGLLGSRWYADHPTVPAGSIAAVINLDQLRPLFPLNILTTLAVNDSTLGQTVREVAAPMGIRIQPDPEPERGLMQRADHWPFVQKGVPAVGFIFGYVPGTEAERRYREWYATRYHLPQDDLSTPIDWEAAGKFNRFFYALTERVADAATPPAWLPGSQYGPKAAAQLEAEPVARLARW